MTGRERIDPGTPPARRSASTIPTASARRFGTTPRVWVSRIDHLSPTAAVLARLIYGRDGKGRITGITSNRAADSWTYGYDGFDQLISADNADPASALDQTFAYSLNGNMRSNSKLGTYAYPTALAEHPHAPTRAGTKFFTYDAAGNMLSDGQRFISYDGENRPVTVNGVNYVYGPDGKRLKKVAADGKVTVYLGADVELDVSTGVWKNTCTRTQNASVPARRP